MSICPSAIEEAERTAFDLSLFDANLYYSYEKRDVKKLLAIREKT